MAGRSKRSGTIGLDLNKMKHELRMQVLEIGMEVLLPLGERIAKEANETAPFIEFEVDKEGEGSEAPLRRGKNKSGKSDSGPIKGTVFSQPSEKVPSSVLVVSPAWYSHLVEYGTDPHDLPRKSKTGKMMVFPGTKAYYGRSVAVKHVNHPGAKSVPFLRPAADKADEFLEEIINNLKNI